MKITITTIALIAAIPLALLAGKDKDVKVKVPEKSGVSVEEINPTGFKLFTLKNTNNYAVRISGSYLCLVKDSNSRSFHENLQMLNLEIKPNASQTVENYGNQSSKLAEINIEKIEKKD